jgi:hypothetical protein
VKNINPFHIQHFISLNEKLNVDWNKSEIDFDYTIDINGNKIKPYEVLLKDVELWLSEMKNAVSANIEKSTDKVLFNLAFNRISNKIFPSLIQYIIPSIDFDGKKVISNIEISAPKFWEEFWPKVWQDLTSPERMLIQKLTILSKDSQYGELIEALGKNLSDGQPYSIHKKEISNQIRLFYDKIGKSFSDMFEGKGVSLNNSLLDQMISDLNSKISGIKLDFPTNP